MKIELTENIVTAIDVAITELEVFENDGWQMDMEADEADKVWDGIEKLKPIIAKFKELNS
jgi:hypothetical protein